MTSAVASVSRCKQSASCVLTLTNEYIFLANAQSLQLALYVVNILDVTPNHVETTHGVQNACTTGVTKSHLCFAMRE